MGERPPVLIGERVLWLGSGSGLPKGGVVKWIGRLPEMGPHWAVGIELDEPLPYGGIDGTWGKRRLFKCRHKHGLIVPHSSVIPQPQQSTRERGHKRVGKEFPESVQGRKKESFPNKGGNKVGKLFRTLSNDESKNRYPDLELPSTHLRNPNLERQLAILGTLRRSKHTELGRLEGVKSEACIYSVILEKEENVFRETQRMIHGREFKRSDDTLDRTSSISSSRSVGSRRDRTSGIFSFLKWFKKERNDDSESESPLPSSPVLQRASGSVTGSIDTLFSTATTRSFAFVLPSHYRPYGSANAPEIRICSGPETNTYRNRIRQRDLLRQSEKNISLREKYRLYASETLPRSVDRINEITEALDHKDYPTDKSSIRRQKRPAPPPPIVDNISASERDLAIAVTRDAEYTCGSRQHRRTLSEPSPTRYVKPCHVKGKRKAPQPPISEKPGTSYKTLSLQRRKRPAPPPPILRSPSDEIDEILRQAVNDISGSTSSLSHLETASTASTVDISQAETIATDTLRLERGFLKPNREEKHMDVHYTPTSPVSPRPWYKRNAASRENSFCRSNERKKDRDRRRVEDWMIESGIPRRPNHLPENRFNIFSKTDKTEEKRRSQISILTNISELDREAAEIVQKNKEKRQAMLADQNNKFFEDTHLKASTNDYFSSEQTGYNIKTNGDVSLFNSITNVTNVTVNSAYFLQNGDLGKAQHDHHSGLFLRNSDGINHNKLDNEQEISIAENPIITDPDQEPGPSRIGRIAKVTIEELDDFDKERNSRAQALYEANRVQRHQSPSIPTITEMSESTATSPGSGAAYIVSDQTSPGPSTVTAKINATKSESQLPSSALRPVVHIVWNCPRCTLENPRWKITCEACDMWRPVPCTFREVTPKHPLPLAVLRIVEPKYSKNNSKTPAPKLEVISNELPNQNGINHVGNVTSNVNGDVRNNDTKITNCNLNTSDEKRNKPAQGLTISDLLFNTKGKLIAQENLKPEDGDILNGLNSKKIINIQEQDLHQTNRHETKQDEVKPVNKNNTVQALSSNDASSSVSDSGISNMPNSHSEKQAANKLQRSSNKDVVEPEEIRKARLAFFEKFILPSSAIVNKPCSDAKRLETKLPEVVHRRVPPSSKHHNDGSTLVHNVHSSGTDKFQCTTGPARENEFKAQQENDIAKIPNDATLDNQPRSINSPEALPQCPMPHRGKTEIDVQTDCSSEGSQTNKSLKVTCNREEDKRKLCEMLIEMKHSLPKRSKEDKQLNIPKKGYANSKLTDTTQHKQATQEKSVHANEQRYPKLGAVRKSVPEKLTHTRAVGFKHEPSSQAEAYLVESETIVEEIKMKKPTEKISPSVHGAMIRQISPQNKPPIGKEVVIPVTVEEYTIKDGVLYTSVSKGAKKIGTGTFQLMRPRDFANVEAIKTRKNESIESPLYANVSHTANIQPLEETKAKNSKELEKLSLQLTEPQGLAHFKAVLENNDSNQMNTIAVNRLLRRLESAIANGQHELAASLAKELAQLKVNCIVTRQKPESNSSQTIHLDMFVEDKETHQGPFPLRLMPSITVENLKLKIEREYEIPRGVQRWIIGRALANDDKASLESLGITESGSALYLYLVFPEDFRPEQMGFARNELEGAVGGDVANTFGQSIESDTIENQICEDNFKNEETSVTSTPVIRKLVEPIIQNNARWKCVVCTLDNGTDRPKCAACESNQPDSNELSTSYPTDANIVATEIDNHEVSQDEKKQDYQKLVDLEKSDLVISLEVFECPICMVEYQPQEGVVLRECLHVFCKSCLANTVEYSDEAEVKCPFRDDNYTCDSSLLEREIKALVTPEVYEQHLAKSIALAETKIGNTFHCKTPDCKGWCIYEDNVNLFRCPVCTHTNCLTCQAIHEGLDCKHFQEQLKKDSEVNVESRRTTEMLQEMVDRGEAMNCPTCQVVLMKKWGCDWLRCSMCKTEICWITRGPRWGPNGKGDTSGGCQCGVNGTKCHPKCTYCH